MFQDVIESMSRSAVSTSSPTQEISSPRIREILSIDYSPMQNNRQIPEKPCKDESGNSMEALEDCAFVKHPPPSKEGSPRLLSSSTNFKSISFPPNPFILYENKVHRRENWPIPPPSLYQTDRNKGGQVILPGSSESIYNARLEQAWSRSTQSLPVIASSPFTACITQDRQRISVDNPSADGPFSLYCGWAGEKFSKVPVLQAPNLELSPKKPEDKSLGVLRPSTAPKDRSSPDGLVLQKCLLRRVHSTCTLDELEKKRGEWTLDEREDKSEMECICASSQRAGWDEHENECIDLHAPLQCPQPLAPSDVEKTCRPLKKLTPKSKLTGLGFGWQNSASSSTSSFSDLVAGGGGGEEMKGAFNPANNGPASRNVNDVDSQRSTMAMRRQVEFLADGPEEKSDEKAPVPPAQGQQTKSQCSRWCTETCQKCHSTPKKCIIS